MNWICRKVFPPSARSYLLKRFELFGRNNRFGTKNPDLDDAYTLVLQREAILHRTRVDRREFFDVEELRDRSHPKLVQSFIQSPKDEEKPTMNRENLLIVFENEPSVSSKLLLQETDRFKAFNPQKNCVSSPQLLIPA